MLPVAVIGAGIAGLACATALQQAGLAVRVFDKSHGAGGRMSTRRGEDWQCDHGVQYFTARDALFRDEVNRWQHAGVVSLWQPRLAVLPDPAHHTQLDPPQRFVGTPGMSAPARWLARRLNLTTLTTVRQLQRRDDGWRLFSDEHGWLPTPHAAVVLALPAPQCVPLLQAAARELAAQAAQIVMRGNWTLMLRYDHPTALPFDAAFVNDGPLRWVACDSSKPGRDGETCWVLHASPEWSDAHLEDTPEAVSEILLAAFAQLGAPSPAAWSAHRWRYADANPALNVGALWQADSGIGVCGDWLNGGKVEGAWLSGQSLAQRIMQSFKG
jgi:hypothetical protein